MDSVKKITKKIYRKIFPNKDTSTIKRILHPARISLHKTQPVSDVFGFDRGTPIDRYYIEKFLEENKSLIHGNILEIADSTYSKRFASSQSDKFHVLTFDTVPENENVISGDLTKPETLPADLMDCFICTQTLNFIYDVKNAIKSTYQLLTVGGVFIGTVGCISQISRYDYERWGDYWRFTDMSIKKMLCEFFDSDKVLTKVYGNAMSAAAFIQGVAFEDIRNKKLLDATDENYQVTIGFIARK